MRHFHQPLLGDELAGRLADAVGLIFDAHEGHLQVPYEFHLVCRQTSALLFREGRCALFEDFERRGGILRVVIGRVGDSGAQQLIVRARILKLFQDELLELLEFGVAVSGSFVCNSRLLLVGFMYN